MIRNELRETSYKEAAGKLAERLSAQLLEKSGNERLAFMFKQCFLSTVDTTMQCMGDDEVFLITGDIEAMWLRDSSAQVCHYMKFLQQVPQLQEMVKGLIVKQFRFIKLDPYANAFNAEPNGRCWTKDRTEDIPWDWERKYELDSLCYPIRLLWQYYEATQDASIFTEEILETLSVILELCKVEQNHTQASPYYFERENCPETDTLPCEGKGTPVAQTGLIWSGFRPSDDACTYGYLIPANLFAAEVLGYVVKIAELCKAEKLGEAAAEMKKEVEAGIEAHGVVKNDKGEEMYVYETDGFGHVNLMDDANVPNLLGIPWYTSISNTDKRYLATRNFVLSKENPYYYEGTAAKGIGSPHTPVDYIWHIGLCIQGMTSASREEQEKLMETILATDAGTGFMHEGFHVDDPNAFTRDWFAWANSLFAAFTIQLYGLE